MKISIRKSLKQNKLSYLFIYVAKYIIARPIIRIVRHTQINIRAKYRWYSKNGKRLQRFKNCKSGKSCVIVGNGPSVRIEDLNTFAHLKIDSFGANRIIDILDQTDWRPTYICVCDSTFLTGVNNTTTCSKYLEDINKSGVEALFAADYLNSFFKSNDSKIYYIDFYESGEYSNKVKNFSEDIALYISELGTVTNFSIQLAVYMGYQKIYLYGMDNSYMKYFGDDGKFHIDNSIKSHVSGIKSGDDDHSTEVLPKNKFEANFIGGFGDIRKANIGYSICREYCDKHGIEIVNITRGGNLDKFVRGCFDDVFPL